MWRIVGILIIAVRPIPVFVLMRQSRRSLLRITPLSLTVAGPGQQPAPTEIPRADVQSIDPTTGRLGNGVTAPVPRRSDPARPGTGQRLTPKRHDKSELPEAGPAGTSMLLIAAG